MRLVRQLDHSTFMRKGSYDGQKFHVIMFNYKQIILQYRLKHFKHSEVRLM